MRTFNLNAIVKNIWITSWFVFASIYANSQPSWELQSPIPSNHAHQENNNERPDSPTDIGARDGHDPATIPLSGLPVVVFLSGVLGVVYIYRESGKIREQTRL